MIHTKNILRPLGLVVIAAALISILGGCSRQEEDLFDKPGDQRVLDMMERFEKTVLAHPNGWEMVYEVPNRDINTSFTFQLQFKDNKGVTIWADFLPEPITSSYRLTAFSGPTLTFDTPGATTILADPSIIPGVYHNSSKDIKGKGYYGENDFMIVSVSDSEIRLRGLKYRKDVVLKPLDSPASLTNEALDPFIEALQLYGSMGSAVGLFDGDTKVSSLEISYDLQYLVAASHLPKVTLYASTTQGEEKVETEHQLITSEDPTKITIEPGLKYDGKELKSFVFDAEKGLYVSQEDPAMTIAPAPIAPSFRPGGKYYGNYFYCVGMSPLLLNFCSDTEMEKVFPNFVELQWYLKDDLRELTFFHKPGGQNNWQSLVCNLEVASEKDNLFRLVVPESDYVYGSELKNALRDSQFNAANVLALFFTSFGDSEKRTIYVILEEVDPANGIVRMTSTTNSFKLWIDFRVAK